MKARRRTRPHEMPLVDDRFRADTDDGEPASRAQLLVSAAPLTFESVPPCLGSAVPSNELDPHTPRGSALGTIMPAPTSSATGAPPSSNAPGSAAESAPGAVRAPAARTRGWLLLTPALLFGVASVVLALKMVLAPSAPEAEKTAAAPVDLEAVQREAPAPPAPEKAPAPPETEPAAVTAEENDDGFEIIETPTVAETGSRQTPRTYRPRSASPRADAPKKEPSSPVIF